MLKRITLSGVVCLFIGGFATGQSVVNWSAPSSWSPAKAQGGMGTMDVTPPLPFIGLAPCRIADTRGNGFTGAYGPPAMAAGSPRNFTLSGQCGIPAGAGAVSLNITVTNTAGPGFIKIFPQGGASPVVSTLNYVAGQTVANAAVVPLSAGGGVTVAAGVSGAQLIIDTNGYYASTPAAAADYFKIINSGPYALYGQTSSGSTNSAGVYGSATATSGITYGVWGDDFSSSAFGIGVLGVSHATTGQTYGVFGRSVSSTGGATGVHGETTDGVGNGTCGVEGVALGEFSVGVLGLGATGSPNGSVFEAGVRGESILGLGVNGRSRSQGVLGQLYDSFGLVAAGTLGNATAPGGPFAVYASGNMGASGTKPFVEVHPTDPTKVIRYVALEGPEAGTYFRGTDQTHNGTAVIDVPASFRLVTDTEGLTVQLTTFGAPATIYVVSQDLNQIVVRSSRDVKFHYMVNGVRQTFKDWQVVVDGGYMPESPSQTLPAYFSDAQKRRLIANGTYNEDGTVNMGTAERVGWTRIWADRKAQAREAAEKARQAAAVRRE